MSAPFSPSLWRSLARVALVICSLLAWAALPSQAQIDLPDLGDTSSITISPQQERLLGEQWLRAFRSQVHTSSDPLLIDYLEQLFERLLPYSQLERKQIDLVVVENSTLNAFAVPGGIIGVHTACLATPKLKTSWPLYSRMSSAT